MRLFPSTSVERRPTFGLHPVQKISSIVSTRVTGRPPLSDSMIFSAEGEMFAAGRQAHRWQTTR
jgi:hypothetical protein